MRLKIIDRNNDTNFYVDEGATITKCKNETLDSAVVRISNLTTKMQIEPFDLCLLNDMLIDDMYMLVDSFSETITCLAPITYTYDITLFSETKELENYLCPNLKITKVWGQTRSVWEYVKQYISEYGPKIRIESGNSYTWTDKFIWSSRLYNRFKNIECPEMQWNKPTLREVLNDLLMIDDCIVIISRPSPGRQPFIDYLDLTEENVVTDLTKINYITSSQSSEDYVSEVKVDLVNVTNPRNDNINNVVTKTEWYHISADTDIINSDNWYVETQYPIYKIKSLRILFAVDYQTTDDFNQGILQEQKWIEADLMNCKLADSHEDNSTVTKKLVYEYQEWRTKKTKYTYTNPFNEFPVAQYDEYQNFTVYYTRGDNKIHNFADIADKTILATYPLWEFLTEKILNAYIVENGLEIQTGRLSVFSKYFSLFFAIEYETLADCVFTASKSETPRHTRVVTDNQTNSYVDSYNAGFLEYQKANRLGNLQKMINARYFRQGEDIQILFIDNIENDETTYTDLGDGTVRVSGDFTFKSTQKFSRVPVILTDIICNFDIYISSEPDNYDTKRYTESCIIDENNIEIDSNGYLSGYIYFDFIVNKSDIAMNVGCEISVEEYPQCLVYFIEPLKISDKIDEDVIYQVQYQMYDNHVEVNALATKNYVLRNYFTGVKAKIRSWKIASGSEALTRHELIKYYLEFNYETLDNDNELLPDGDIAYIELPYYFLLPFKATGAGPITHVAVKTKDSSGNYYPSGTSYYALDLIARIVGNSLVFTFSFNDNYWAGTGFDNDEITYNNTTPGYAPTVEGGYPVEHYRYTDDNGEITRIIYNLTDSMDNNNQYEDIEPGENTDFSNSTNKHFVISSLYKPLIDVQAFSTNELAHVYFDIHKDSQEILSVSTQFEICTQTTDFAFTRLFIERQAFVKVVPDTDFSILIYTGPSSRYNFKSPDLTDIQSTSLTVNVVNVNDERAYLEIIDSEGFATAGAASTHLSNLVKNKAIYIFYKNINGLLFYMNNAKSLNAKQIGGTWYGTIRVYLNLLRDRNKNVYASQSNQIFIKEI